MKHLPNEIAEVSKVLAQNHFKFFLMSADVTSDL